jgi:heme-degrading monooxygenase HmoA
MKQAFIDKFFVPKVAVEEFLQRTNYNRSFIRNLPGFIKDSAYERTDQDGNLIVITVVIWESQEAINKAKETVQTEYKRIGFDPAEMFSRLNITIERGTYKDMMN